jgi:hypothetical protein
MSYNINILIKKGDKKLDKKRIMIISLCIGGFFIICSFLCCFGFLLNDTDTNTDTDTDNITIEKTETDKAIQKTEKPKIKPTVTKFEKKEYELSNGNYTSGKNFDAGIYNIEVVKGNGNVSSDNMFDGGINAVMGTKDDEMYQKEYKNIKLPKGTELKIYNVTIKLTKVK